MIRSSMPIDRALAILEVARELEPSARASYISLICARDTDLKDRVMVMLAQLDLPGSEAPTRA